MGEALILNGCGGSGMTVQHITAENAVSEVFVMEHPKRSKCAVVGCIRVNTYSINTYSGTIPDGRVDTSRYDHYYLSGDRYCHCEETHNSPLSGSSTYSEEYSMEEGVLFTRNENSVTINLSLAYEKYNDYLDSCTNRIDIYVIDYD